MFSRRDENTTDNRPGIQDILRSALRLPGCQVLLHGDTGVGKTSLLRHVADELKLGWVEFQCRPGITHAEILDGLVREVVTVKEIEYRRHGSVEMSLAAGSSVPFIASLRGKIRKAGGRETTYSVVEKDAVSVLLDVLPKANRTLIVLENFHHLQLAPGGRETAALVARTLVQLSDNAALAVGPDPKAVLVGIAEGLGELLREDAELVRRCDQIGVPFMPDEEIRQILSKGFSRLDISAGSGALDQLTFYSDGFPYYAHVLGLYASEAVLASRTREITDSHLGIALIRAAERAGATFRTARRLAVGAELPDGRMPRTNIMRLLALDDTRRRWTSSDVKSMWESRFGAVETRTITNALTDLCKPERGKILRRNEEVTPRQYQFQDAQMRPYLRMVDRIG